MPHPMNTIVHASGALKAFLDGRQKGISVHELMKLKAAALAEHQLKTVQRPRQQAPASAAGLT